ALIRALKAGASGPLIAFGPHVDAERRKAARAAGADRVLAKSKFVTELPRLMAATSPHGPGGQGSPARDVRPG
ncbi:MAG: hypothetical protein JOZ41_05480, partial [Chloroflexi bacterium]|nr:hypothetical protein [Chloroflexota bacterium]